MILSRNQARLPSRNIDAAPEVIDLLPAGGSSLPFKARVQNLALSRELEKKILDKDSSFSALSSHHDKTCVLTIHNEKELATEVLRYRHLFTVQLLTAPKFRQAVLTIIQNIYLFNNRKIFFGTTTASAETERQEALLMFSSSAIKSLPLAKTFQHLIIARIWRRIFGQASKVDFHDKHFAVLLDLVEKLNTLRNIYVLLTTGLVRKLASHTNPLYKQSISYEDAVQIGSIGIARAAYRYHPSSGVRFSTFAARWVYREIQRQSLDGRLIRINTNTLENCAKAIRNNDLKIYEKLSEAIESTSSVERGMGDQQTLSELHAQSSSPSVSLENRQMQHVLLQTINQVLSKNRGDIIKRRYGLPPYQGQEQSILSISEVYKVTRGSIYQQEQAALKKLHFHLRSQIL